MFDQRLTELMARKLNAVLLKTSASEVVANYNQVQITRGGT